MGDEKFDLQLKPSDIFIEGGQVGDTDNNKCYLPIFKAPTLNDEWILGGTVFRNYYVVYDLTPHTERDENYLQIGLGKRIKSRLHWEKYGGELWDSHHSRNRAADYPKSYLIALAALGASSVFCGIYWLCKKYVEGPPNLKEE